MTHSTHLAFWDLGTASFVDQLANVGDMIIIMPADFIVEGRSISIGILCVKFKSGLKIPA